jgi:hypothetical protein
MKGSVAVAGAWAQLVASTASACALDAAAAEALAGGLRVIEENNLSEYAVTWFLDSASAAVASDIAPKFWAYFDGFESVKGSKGVAAWASARVSAALLFLSQALDAQLQVARAIESSSAESDRHYDVVSSCRANMAAVVFRPVPLYFHEILYLFLSKEFADFARKTAGDRADDEESDDDESDEEAQGDDSMVIEGEEVGTHETSNFRQVCLSINHVGALPMAEEVLTEVLYDKIAQRIKKKCAGQWDTRVLGNNVESWARRSVWPLLRQLHSSVSSPTEDSSHDDTMEEVEDAKAGEACHPVPASGRKRNSQKLGWHNKGPAVSRSRRSPVGRQHLTEGDTVRLPTASRDQRLVLTNTDLFVSDAPRGAPGARRLRAKGRLHTHTHWVRLVLRRETPRSILGDSGTKRGPFVPIRHQDA